MSTSVRPVPARFALALALLVTLSAAAALCTDDDDDDGDGDGGNGDGDGNGDEYDGWTDLTGLEALLTNMEGFGYSRGTGPEDIEGLESPERTLVLFVGADRNVTGRERTAMEDLVRSGGAGLLACDDTAGNPLALRFGLKIDTHRIIATNYEVNYSFIPSETELDGREYSLLFNNPMALFPDEGEPVTLAASADFSTTGPVEGTTEGSAADMNGNDEIDHKDKYGPIDIAQLVPGSGGEGPFVLVSDTGFMTDDLIDRHDNREFIEGLIDYLRPRGGELMLYVGAQEEQRSPNILYSDGTRSGDDEGGGTRADGDDISVDNGDLRFHHADGRPVSYSYPVTEGEEMIIELSIYSGGATWVDVSVVFNITRQGEAVPVVAKMVNASAAPGEVTPVNISWTAALGEYSVEAVVVPAPGSDDLPGDNRAVRPMEVNDGVDLSVTVTLSNENVTAGELITVSALVENYAPRTVEYNLELVVVYGDGDREGVDTAGGEVGPDLTSTGLFQWEALEGVVRLSVIVEPQGLPELDYSDNTAEASVNVTADGSDDDGSDDEARIPGATALVAMAALLVSVVLGVIVSGTRRR